MTPQDLVKNIHNLVSLPDVVIRINELIDSPTASMSDIGDVIAQDAGLSAKLLKLVNSPMYRYQGEVSTISQALTVIGTNELRSLAVASSAVTAFEGISESLIDMNTFWLRSVYCGIITRKIAAETRLPS